MVSMRRVNACQFALCINAAAAAPTSFVLEPIRLSYGARFPYSAKVLISRIKSLSGNWVSSDSPVVGNLRVSAVAIMSGDSKQLQRSPET